MPSLKAKHQLPHQTVDLLPDNSVHRLRQKRANTVQKLQKQDPVKKAKGDGKQILGNPATDHVFERYAYLDLQSNNILRAVMH